MCHCRSQTKEDVGHIHTNAKFIQSGYTAFQSLYIYCEHDLMNLGVQERLNITTTLQPGQVNVTKLYFMINTR